MAVTELILLIFIMAVAVWGAAVVATAVAVIIQDFFDKKK
jgi:hypothetical protein